MTRLRVKETRTTTANGTSVVKRTIVSAPELEWRLQAAGVRRLRQMPGYGAEAGPHVEFTIAGDFNASRRSPQESMKAKATGLTAGEEDLRVYMRGGKLGLVEYKGANGRVSDDQKVRHALHKSLGFDVVVIKAATEQEAADATEALVKAWLGRAANDYERQGTARDPHAGGYELQGRKAA